MELVRIYFTQGRFQGQNNIIFAYRANYAASTSYYTYVGFYDAELIGNTVKVDLEKYFSPIAAWDSENSVGLGANYQVSSGTSVAGYGSLRDLESRALIEDSRSHWRYYRSVEE